MSGNKKTSAMILANKKREDISSKTYTVERLLKRRKKKVNYIKKNHIKYKNFFIRVVLNIQLNGNIMIKVIILGNQKVIFLINHLLKVIKNKRNQQFDEVYHQKNLYEISMMIYLL